MSTETTVTRDEPRAMLALITLTALPVPKSIGFHPNGEILSLSFERIADGQAWSRHLGGKTDTYVSGDGRTYLNEGVIEWRGWSVQLHVSEQCVPDVDLDENTTARLMAVATCQAGGASSKEQ